MFKNNNDVQKAFYLTKFHRITVRIIAPLLFLLAAPVLTNAQSLEGVWLGTEIQTIGGDNAGTVAVTTPRLLIYTKGFFSWTFENVERENPGEGASDAELADSLRNLNVAAGTYMRDGTIIRYIRRVTGFPEGQLPENQPFDREIRALTENLLETSVTNNDGVTLILRYRRVE
jgi:hypothetical protein